MKKRRWLVVLLIITALLFSSCTGADTNPPAQSKPSSEEKVIEQEENKMPGSKEEEIQDKPDFSALLGANREIQDLIIFEYDVPVGWAGPGDCLETVNSQVPLDKEVTLENKPSLRFHITRAGGWSSQLTIRSDWATLDVTKYVPNGALEFYVKGAKGGEQFQIRMNDRIYEPSGDEKQLEPVPVGGGHYVDITTDWQHVSIPLTELFALDGRPNPANAWQLFIEQASNEPMTFWICDIKLTTPDKEPSYPHIKVNQLGYIPSQKKYALVTGFPDEFVPPPGTAFEVRDTSNDQVVYTGTLERVSFLDKDSGESVYRADFSSLEQPGEYYITVSMEGVEPSLKFAIGDKVYDEVFVDVSRYFLYQRANIDLKPPYVTDYPRKALHPDDADCPLYSDKSIRIDASKGWYDAGDTGKYVNPGAIAASDLLWAYELFPEAFEDNQFNIPESGNGVPDILDEVRYELEFILNMQDPSTGGFYFRVKSDGDNITAPRYVKDKRDADTTGGIKSTPVTANAVAVLAQASIVYRDFDEEFSNRCLEAAKKGWAYLEANPKTIPVPSDGPYMDNEDFENRLWAAGALYRATGDDALGGTYFKEHYKDTPVDNKWTKDHHFSSEDPFLLGYFHYICTEKPDPAVVEYFKAKFQTWKDARLQHYKRHSWSISLSPEWGIWWGSNGRVLGIPMAVAIGSKLTDTYGEEELDFIHAAVNYILGINPLRKSYVSGHGEDCITEIFSTLYSSDGKPGIPKGYLPGGPNSYEPKFLSRFPLKSYQDVNSDWTTSENAIYWNSPMVFDLAAIRAKTLKK